MEGPCSLMLTSAVKVKACTTHPEVGAAKKQKVETELDAQLSKLSGDPTFCKDMLMTCYLCGMVMVVLTCLCVPVLAVRDCSGCDMVSAMCM